MCDDEAVGEVVDVLNGIFGGRGIEVPQPIGVRRGARVGGTGCVRGGGRAQQSREGEEVGAATAFWGEEGGRVVGGCLPGWCV